MRTAGTLFIAALAMLALASPGRTEPPPAQPQQAKHLKARYCKDGDGDFHAVSSLGICYSAPERDWAVAMCFANTPPGETCRYSGR